MNIPAIDHIAFFVYYFSVINIPPKEDGPSYDVVALLDPSSRAAQKYTPLIMVLQQVANVNIKVFLNCRDKLSEMPLKRLVFVPVDYISSRV